jgi:hypothetical protein
MPLKKPTAGGPLGEPQGACRRTKGGPNPATKACRKGVMQLARSGLRDALEVLEGRLYVVGASVFSVRGEVLLVTASLDSEKQVRRGA